MNFESIAVNRDRLTASAKAKAGTRSGVRGGRGGEGAVGGGGGGGGSAFIYSSCCWSLSTVNHPARLCGPDLLRFHWQVTSGLCAGATALDLGASRCGGLNDARCRCGLRLWLRLPGRRSQRAARQRLAGRRRCRATLILLRRTRRLVWRPRGSPARASAPAALGVAAAAAAAAARRPRCGVCIVENQGWQLAAARAGNRGAYLLLVDSR